MREPATKILKLKSSLATDLRSRKDLAILGSLFIGYLHEQSSYLMCLINDLILNFPSQASQKRAIKTATFLEKSLKETRELINDGDIRVFNIDAEIRSCIRGVAYYKTQKKIKISFNKSGLTLTGYNNIFRQIIICVLLNAIEAFEKNNTQKRIEIKAEKYRSNNKNVLKIVILDNAGGIEESVLRKLFLPKQSKKRDGTGLGLYFASMAIHEFFNGKLSLQTQKGQGTTLLLEFLIG